MILSQKYRLLFLLSFIFFSIQILALEKDSTSWKSFEIGLNMINDDQPLSNQQDYTKRKRDDHGLTLAISYFAEANLRLFKNTHSNIKYENFLGLYSRDIGSLSIIKKDNPDYDYFSYILAKHPDWDNVLLYDQVAITKNVNKIEMNNTCNNFIYSLMLKHTQIDADAKQRGTDIQHWLHKSVNARNYYHTPFLDSSIFKGSQFNYFSLGVGAAYSFKFNLKEKFSLELIPKIGMWYNTINKYSLVPFSPFASVSINSSYGKKIGVSKRFSLLYNFYVEPNERLQYYSDPGSKGFQSLTFEVNFTGLRKRKIEECKSWFIHYKLIPFSIYFPVAVGKDPIINYIPKSGNKASLIGICNFTLCYMFK